jgi:hypothetical protein
MAVVGHDRAVDSRPYSALIRAIGEQARELYPGSTWKVASRELEQLWRSYVSATGIGWEAVEPRIHEVWEDSDLRVDPSEAQRDLDHGR